MNGVDTLVTIANHFDAAQQVAESNGQGLNLIKSLLPKKSANLVARRAGGIYMAELKLSPPVTIT